jgi:ABC-type Fe3+-hydroxamate transport system substrate-binding protein
MRAVKDQQTYIYDDHNYIMRGMTLNMIYVDDL